MSTVRIGIDTGGTFTDCVLAAEGQPPLIVKIPSTPHNPAEAIVSGLERLCEKEGVEVSAVDFVCHGTTVATNAMLQRQWSRVGLITTRGFRDTLEIGTQMRPDLYSITGSKPPPLVPRELRLEVDERVAADGSVVAGLDRAGAAMVIDQLVGAGVEAIAVSLLFSFRMPEHELELKRMITERAPGVYVCVSSEVSPEVREFPRTSSTVLNAALAPVVRDYLDDLREQFDRRSIASQLHIMQSSGGMISADEAAHSSHKLLLSGPAGGVVAAAATAAAAGFPDCLTFDMGGTSSDVGLIRGGEPRQRQAVEVLDAYPLLGSTVDMHTIGAGGGSIAWQDSGGSLKVGPQSAGAVPGPVCYDLGGTEPTVTDANYFLGRLHPDQLLGGEMTVNTDLSAAALERLAGEMGLETERLAWGILEVANANMAGALRVVSSRRGYDPRDFALVPFGGAGPLHATALARELGIRNVLIPPAPGAFSAVGLLMSDLRHDMTEPWHRPLTPDQLDDLEAGFAGLETTGSAWLGNNGIAADAVVLDRSIDLRYAGQEYHLSIPAPGRFDPGSLAELESEFHRAHERTYGHAAPGEPIEVVNLRLAAVGEVGSSVAGHRSTDAGTYGRRKVFFDGHGWVETAVLSREEVMDRGELEGPSIIAQLDTTVVIEPGQKVLVDENANLVVKIEEVQA